MLIGFTFIRNWIPVIDIKYIYQFTIKVTKIQFFPPSFYHLIVNSSQMRSNFEISAANLALQVFLSQTLRKNCAKERLYTARVFHMTLSICLWNSIHCFTFLLFKDKATPGGDLFNLFTSTMREYMAYKKSPDEWSEFNINIYPLPWLVQNSFKNETCIASLELSYQFYLFVFDDSSLEKVFLHYFFLENITMSYLNLVSVYLKSYITENSNS